MSPSVELRPSSHRLPSPTPHPPDQDHWREKRPCHSQLEETQCWILGKNVGAQWGYPEEAMTLQAPSQARASHGQQWQPNGSEKSFPLFSSMSLSEDSMEHGLPQRKAGGKGVKKDIMALINLMILVPVISIGTALYAFLATIYALLSIPIRLCIPKRSPPASQLTRHLLPALNLHLKTTYSSRRYYSPPPPSDIPWPGTMPTTADTTPSPASRDSNAINTNIPALSRLLTVLLTSPLLAMPIACSASVLAIFWMLSALTTDETADSDNGRSSSTTLDDGRWQAKRLRKWWIRWLTGQLFERRGRTRTRHERRTSRR